MENTKLSRENQKTLMVQLNVDIDRAATEIAETVTHGDTLKMLYPPSPDDQLSEGEIEAINMIKNIPNVEGALKKMIAEGAAKVAFNFLNYLDGTGDPGSKSGKWSGVALIVHPLTGDPYEQMLHDEFYDSYWDAKALRGK